MKPYSSDPTLAARPEVLRARHSFGIWFGMALGLSFSIFAWGVDAYLLQQMNGLLPWLKFLGGVVPCMLAGGLTGWLSARLGKPLLAMLLWGATAALYAWLTVSLPLQITPRILSLVEPGITELLHYTYYEAFSARLAVAYIWIAIFVSLAGLLQIPLSDSAVFATSFFGKISPLLFTLVLMAICGTIVDSLNNERLRAPVHAVDTTVRFALEHRDQEVSPEESRRMRLGALRSVTDQVSAARKFIVSGYDQFLEQVQVLVRFEAAWVECELVVNQLTNCRQVGVR